MERKSLAWVIEGGGLRGAFCAGALSVLDDVLPYGPDYLFAASAGAPCAAYYATGQIRQAIRIWENYTHASHLVSPMHWLRGRPLMDIDKLVSRFKEPEALAVERLPSAPSQVHVAVTNCQTGTADYVLLDNNNAFNVLTATMALPLAYGRVVQVDGTPYVDGGLSDSIPIEAALRSGAEELVVVLTQPIDYRKHRSSFAESLFSLQMGRYPRLFDAFRSRPERYNACVERLNELEASGRVSVIRPTSPLPASRITRNRDRILETIEAGRVAARTWHANRS